MCAEEPFVFVVIVGARVYVCVSVMVPFVLVLKIRIRNYSDVQKTHRRNVAAKTGSKWEI